MLYAGGFEQRIDPDPHGFVLEAVASTEREAGNRIVEIRGVAADGTIVDRQRIPPPGG